MGVIMELQNGAKEQKRHCDLNAQLRTYHDALLRTYHADPSHAITKNTTMRTKLTSMSKIENWELNLPFSVAWINSETIYVYNVTHWKC
jgi:hypothetical protein